MFGRGATRLRPAHFSDILTKYDYVAAGFPACMSDGL
jgi:uncharacterized protein YutD